MFVGRDDKCTKFLVHILKDNRMLLISLCPTNIERNQSLPEKSMIISNDSESIEFFSLQKYNNLKKCLKRIIKQEKRNMLKW